MIEKIRFTLFNIMGICSLFNVFSNALIIAFKGEVAIDSVVAQFFPVTALIAIFYSMWLGMQMGKRKLNKVK
jgi:hypothetical protein